MLIEVTPADLVGCRYAISPLVETTSAMWTLLGHDPGGILRPWRARMRLQYVVTGLGDALIRASSG